MMESYAEVVAADRRLVILRLLVENGGHAGESVIEKGLHLFGHRVGVTRDQVRADLRVLQDRDCLLIDFFEDKVMVAKITRRGVDAAAGQIAVEGVAKPSMGA